MRMNKQSTKQLIELLKELHLPIFREYHQEFAQKAIANELAYEEYLYELAQRECEVRRANKIARLVKASKLPLEKTLQTFELKRFRLRYADRSRCLPGEVLLIAVKTYWRSANREVVRRICSVEYVMSLQGREERFTLVRAT